MEVVGGWWVGGGCRGTYLSEHLGPAELCVRLMSGIHTVLAALRLPEQGDHRGRRLGVGGLR